jgi:hypothetical protein
MSVLPPKYRSLCSKSCSATTSQSASSAGLVSVFTQFTQARMLPSESIIQYCSRLRGLATELGHLGQPISEPLLLSLVIHSLTPQFTYFSGQVATGHRSHRHHQRLRKLGCLHPSPQGLRDTCKHSPLAGHRVKYPGPCGSGLDWIGQPNFNRQQTGRPMAAFACPIHRHNDHTLDWCGALKRSVNVTSETDPPSGVGSGNTHGGSDRGSDDRGRVTVADAFFTAHPANNPFAALASPSPVCDPITTSMSLPTATLDTDFTYAFTASQGILTPTLGSHSNTSIIRYLGSACQVMLTLTQLPPIQEICISTVRSPPPPSTGIIVLPWHFRLRSHRSFLQGKQLLYHIHQSYWQVYHDGKWSVHSIPVLGMGMVSITTNGVPVKHLNCFHTRGIRASLYSLQRHHRPPCCAFVGDHQGMYLTFGKVYTRFQDDIDCRIQIRPLPLPPHPNLWYDIDHTT